MKSPACLILFIIFTLSIASGCILPIPHTRVRRPDCGGIVSDAITDKPVPNAMVEVVYEGGTNCITYTDSSGRWAIPGEKTWHAAILIGVPMSYSLLPSSDGFQIPCMITIKSEGYDKFLWTSCVSESELSRFEEGLPLKDSPIVDLNNVRLNPKVMGRQNTTDAQ